ncbi:hypothetical protein D9619_007718 [Psilocybe cf. subviscida]|uniref:RRM domain-containing protein n=1 Tax=Psilocybe cf. subviscida TaxID=2480587 RepID=A0A8H5ET20_9AGAR|nr:hypothetical protein D9619_007718 [Psilocybe cf. subviscida]
MAGSGSAVNVDVVARVVDATLSSLLHTYGSGRAISNVAIFFSTCTNRGAGCFTKIEETTWIAIWTATGMEVADAADATLIDPVDRVLEPTGDLQGEQATSLSHLVIHEPVRQHAQRRRSRRSRSSSRSRWPADVRLLRVIADGFVPSRAHPGHCLAVGLAAATRNSSAASRARSPFLCIWEFWLAAGEVLVVDVLVTPTYRQVCFAKRFIRELFEQLLMSRLVSLIVNMRRHTTGQRLDAAPSRPPSHNHFGAASNPGNQLYMSHYPYSVGCLYLEDLFRTAGIISVAYINVGTDGRAEGSGTVVSETLTDVQQAITIYRGFDWHGRTLEVREDRYAVLFGGGGPRRGIRGGLRSLRGFHGGLRSVRGGGGFSGTGGRNSDHQGLYAEYSGPVKTHCAKTPHSHHTHNSETPEDEEVVFNVGAFSSDKQLSLPTSNRLDSLSVLKTQQQKSTLEHPRRLTPGRTPPAGKRHNLLQSPSLIPTPTAPDPTSTPNPPSAARSCKIEDWSSDRAAIRAIDFGPGGIGLSTAWNSDGRSIAVPGEEGKGEAGVFGV